MVCDLLRAAEVTSLIINVRDARLVKFHLTDMKISCTKINHPGTCLAAL